MKPPISTSLKTAQPAGIVMTLPELLEYAFLAGGFTTRSNTARDNPEVVAEAAQKSLLTTLTPRDGYSNVWRLTGAGYGFLQYTIFDEAACANTEGA